MPAQQGDEACMTKLSWRTSTTWRSARPLDSWGSNARKAAKSPSSKRVDGGNCHKIGPSFGPSSSTPPPMKRSTEAPAAASSRRCVA
jgi:hypothetical protein